MGRVRVLLKSLSTGVFVTIFILAVGEFAVRLGEAYYAEFATTREKLAIVPTDPPWQWGEYLRGEFVPVTNLQTSTYGKVSINSQGFRSGEISHPDVVTIGDSVTFGWGATENSTTYPAQLENMLKQSGFSSKVLNAGMPRWNSYDLLDMFVAKILPQKPKVLVFLPSWNDLGFQFAKSCVEEKETKDKSSLVRNLKALREHLRFLDVATTKIEKILKDFGYLNRKVKPQVDIASADISCIDLKSEDRFRLVLKAFAEIAKANNIRIILVTLPNYLGHPDKKYIAQKISSQLTLWPKLGISGWKHLVEIYNSFIREEASRLSLPIADCGGKVNYKNFIDMGHLTDAGNIELAQCVAPVVIEALKLAGNS